MRYRESAQATRPASSHKKREDGSHFSFELFNTDNTLNVRNALVVEQILVLSLGVFGEEADLSIANVNKRMGQRSVVCRSLGQCLVFPWLSMSCRRSLERREGTHIRIGMVFALASISLRVTTRKTCSS